MTDAASWPRRLLNSGRVGALAAVERRIPYWPIERVERLQRYRLRAIVRHAYETVPYYRRAMDERGLRPGDFRTVADLAKLPLLGDETVRRDPDQFASTRYDDRSRLVYQTSGALTNVRKLIYWDPESLLLKLPRAERSRAVITKLVGQGWGQRQLFIFVPGGDVERLRGFWDARTLRPRRLSERLFVPSLLPFDVLVERMVAFRPHVVYSNGSSAEHFCRALVERGVTVPAPRLWVYGADRISPVGRALIEEHLGSTLYSSYHATETGMIGFQCERREGFHLNVDLCAVRVVDETGRAVPDGEAGELVVSNLHNRAMVLLNYRIGDRGALAVGRCPCGRSLPLLDRLEGRCSEVLVLPDGRTLSSLQVDYSFGEVLEEAVKTQVVQPTPGRVLWRIVPFAGVDRAAMRRAVQERARTALGEETRVEVEFVEDIPSTSQGKFARVVSAPAAAHVEPPVLGQGP